MPPGPPGMTDEQRLEAIRAGDEDVFLGLYRQLQGGIYRFALRMIGDTTLAEDVVQEVFLILIGAGSGPIPYDPERGSLASYLYGIARNLVLKRLQARGRWIPMPYQDEDEGSSIIDLVGNTVDPLIELSRQEAIESVRRAILALPDHYREAIVLCDLHEMSYQETARILDCSIGTVRSRLHRGRMLLFDKLKGESSPIIASINSAI